MATMTLGKPKLTRKPLPKPPDLPNSPTLLKDFYTAFDVPTYGPLAATVLTPVRALSEALRQIELDPIDTRKVRLYQKKTTKEKFHPAGIHKAGVWLMVLFMPMLPYTLYQIFWLRMANSTMWLGAVLSLICSVVGLFMRYDSGGGSLEKSYWKSDTLRNYLTKDGIAPPPDFVVADATRIKQMVPNANFSVEYLVHEEGEVKHVSWFKTKMKRLAIALDPDPFILVTAGNEKFYIHVWDEDDFERQL